MASGSTLLLENLKKNKSHQYCCVPQCNNYYTGNISMHGFPLKNKLLCKKWQINLKIGKAVTAHMKVCSNHFNKEDFILFDSVNKRRCLKKNAFPSQNLPHGIVQKLPSFKTIQAKQNRITRLKRRNERTVDNQKFTSLNEEMFTPQRSDKCDMEAATALLQLYNVHKHVQIPRKNVEEKAVQVNTFVDISLKFDIADVINTEYRLKFCTGVNNLKLFEVIVNTISKICPPFRKFCIRKQILLTLMKIKLGLTISFLALLFNISQSRTRRFFGYMCRVLGQLFKSLIRFPSKDEIMYNLPKCFSNFPRCRIVLDCTEILIEKSSCVKCRLRSYSFYKKNHTCKFLIGVAPSGLITFVSKAYGGRASDKAIFNKENLIERFLPGQDAIMVDKGFAITTECAENLVELIRPPFLRKGANQFSKEETIRTAEIARARVHVERSIQRIKTFAILKYRLPFSILPFIDDIMIIVAGLVNLSEPILASNKF